MFFNSCIQEFLRKFGGSVVYIAATFNTLHGRSTFHTNMLDSSPSSSSPNKLPAGVHLKGSSSTCVCHPYGRPGFSSRLLH